MTNEEIQFKNNHQKALKFEDEILNMLKRGNSIRESVIHLSEDIFLENEGEVIEFLKLKKRFGNAALDVYEMKKESCFENTFGMDRF